MEYISIPWSNHYQKGVRNYESWTVNLALWFMHILAGNNYQADWKYGFLQDEDAAAPTPDESRDDSAIDITDEYEDERGENKEDDGDRENESSDSDESGATVPLELGSAKKRRWDADGEEEYSLSFSKRPMLGITSST